MLMGQQVWHVGAEEARYWHHGGGQRHEGAHVCSREAVSMTEGSAKDRSGREHGIGEHVGSLAFLRRRVWAMRR